MSRKKNSLSAKGIKWVAILLIGVAVGMLFYMENMDQSFTNALDLEPKKAQLKSMDHVMAFDPGSRVNYGIYKNDFFQCSKDGLKKFTASKDEKWNETYTLNSPIIVTEQSIIAVGEREGRRIYVFNESGKLFEASTEHPLINFAVNKLGYLAVTQQTKKGYSILVFTNKGEQLLGPIFEEPQIYPVGMDISDDGRILAVSCLDVSGTKMRSSLVFYYLWKEEGKSFQDNMFAALNKEDMIDLVIPTIGYMEDNTLIAVGDKRIIAVDEKGNELWSRVLSNKIHHVSLQPKKNFVIAFGESFPGEKPGGENRIVWYNLKGEITADFSVQKEVTHLYADEYGAAFGTTRTFYGSNTQGKLLWEYTATRDIKQLLPFEDKKRVLVVYKDQAEVMEVVR